METNGLDRDVSSAASQMARTGLSGPEARQVLNGLCSEYLFLIDCLALDASGKVTAAAPLKYEGALVEKLAVWSSVRLHDTVLRVITFGEVAAQQ